MTSVEIPRYIHRPEIIKFKGQTGIYVITCTISGKLYIGSSSDIYMRFHQHRTALRNNRHHNQHLQRAWKLYGERAFTFDILQPVANVENLHLIEESWIKLKQATNPKIGFNQAESTGCPNRGAKMSDIFREKCKNRPQNQNNDGFVKAAKLRSASQKGKTNGRGFKVAGFDSNGIQVVCFDSIKMARRNGYPNVEIALKTENRTIKGLIFKRI